MCGGVGFNIKKIAQKNLDQYFTKAEQNLFNQKGEIQSFFWGKRPVLPVEERGETKLMDWGNRDKKAPFPQTGWARADSLKAGKWNYLKPEKVKIPVEKGYEKGVWFDFKAGTEGVVLEKEGEERVYMITGNASQEYKSITGHQRMPVGKIKFRK